MPTLEIIAPRMLVVDDLADNRELLRRSFARRGYAVIEAATGDAALALVDNEPFDIVLLDVMMPGLDGMAVLKHIRRHFSPGRLPVIMVTARSGIDEVVEALECGANDYLTKPVALPIAHARVTNQLERKRTEDAHQRAVMKLTETIRELQGENMQLRSATSRRNGAVPVSVARESKVLALSIPTLID